jgi:PAS domain S-box-containing protein
LAPVRDWIAQEREFGRALVESAISVNDAAKKLRSQRYDAIVCDLGPEEEAGLDLLQQLRARDDPTTFVLIVETEAQEVTVERARGLGSTVVLGREELSVQQLSNAVGIQKPSKSTSRRRNVDLVPAMIWKTDEEGQFTHFSRRWCLFRGRSEEKERGVGWLDGIHPADVSAWVTLHSSALTSRQEFRIDLRLCAAGGDYRWVRFHGVPGFSADGSFTGHLGSSFDITDLKQEHQKGVAQLEQLSHVNRELEGFLHAVCHDLHEPLRTLESDLKTLSGERVKPAFQNVNRMRELLRGLLECAQVSTRGEPIEFTDMSAPLEWALANLRQLIDETRAQVTHDPLPVVRADGTQMAQVLQNLIGNAIKFRRNAPPVVHLSVSQTPDEWQFRIQDNGVGIDPRFHEMIFEPFKRLPGSDETSRGMGLTICAKIIERHGGRIWLESEVAKGSAFLFSIPKS